MPKRYVRKSPQVFPAEECLMWPLKAKVTMKPTIGAASKYEKGDVVLLYEVEGELKLGFMSKDNFDETFALAEGEEGSLKKTTKRRLRGATAVT